MKLYILIRSLDYSQSVILGAFPTLQAAQAHAETLAKDNGDELDRDLGDMEDEMYNMHNVADAFFFDGEYHEIVVTQLHAQDQEVA
jgi:hypothetical protein